ncbi:hypothetical protein [Burkholderia sp. AU32262]|uniref:hypothetical protein n=1 Tax=Burkholderia sp. AU32262 TaxID=2879630 RepID=UPI001CF3F988|nr:hypothetical protein [Burkholderia sp. AU32262]MCA8242860.1 hypothetical protein [Burkholderia sp. AU32262]
MKKIRKFSPVRVDQKPSERVRPGRRMHELRQAISKIDSPAMVFTGPLGIELMTLRYSVEQKLRDRKLPKTACATALKHYIVSPRT